MSIFEVALDEQREHVPDLSLAQKVFELERGVGQQEGRGQGEMEVEGKAGEDAAAGGTVRALREAVLGQIEANGMAPFLQYLVEQREGKALLGLQDEEEVEVEEELEDGEADGKDGEGPQTGAESATREGEGGEDGQDGAATTTSGAAAADGEDGEKTRQRKKTRTVRKLRRVRDLEVRNKEELADLMEKKEEAEETEGDLEVLEAMFAIARFYCRIGHRAKAYEAYDAIVNMKKTGISKKLDAVMEKSRLALFYGERTNLRAFLDEAKAMNEAPGGGGDWDRRNRLKVYDAMYHLMIRNIQEAASLLIDCVATFTCVEVCSYRDFMFYVVVTNVLSLKRTELREKVINSPDVLSVIRDIPHLAEFLQNLYNCDYEGFFRAILGLHARLENDRYLSAHTRYLVREYRVLAYTQFLEAYRSVTLSAMARTFGVSTDFIDSELSRFVAANRISAKIDKVGDVVETNRPDKKNAQYHDVIRRGDGLLNRIQRLSRVVDV